MPHDYLAELNVWEAGFGNGCDPDNPMAWVRNSRARDLQHNTELVEHLYRIDFHKIFIPQQAGGSRQNWLQLWLKVALAARRNINVMPAVMYSIGPCIVFELVASTYQKKQIFSDLLAGKQYSFCLSEPAAGTNLHGIKTCAKAEGQSWWLQGCKGPLGWSRRSAYALILAKTAAAGPASLSFFRVPISHTDIQRVPLSGRGMAGQEFAMLKLNNVRLPEDSLIGECGRGLEQTLIVQQLVKYMSTAANSGGCQSLIRDVLGYVCGSYEGRCLANIAAVRGELAMCIADLLLLEASALVSGGLLNARRKQFSIAASVTKQLALQVSDKTIARLRDLISVNYSLDGHPIHQRFHKVCDDLAMVRFIDTNPAINIKNIITQLPEVERQWRRLDINKAALLIDELMSILNLQEMYIKEEATQLAVTNSQGDYVCNGIKALTLCATQNDVLQDLARDLTGLFEIFWQQFAKAKSEIAGDTFLGQQLAAEYCRLHGCAALLLFLNANPTIIQQLPVTLEILRLQLQALTTGLLHNSTAALENIFQYARRAWEHQQAFSMVPVRLHDFV